MELIIFIGLQAAGKSSFYREKFVDTHIRINLDMLKTRHREKILFDACLEAKQPVVIDNTNPRIEDRKRYILPAKEKGFKIIGYYFKSILKECQLRNSQRNKSIPLVGLFATAKKLHLPSYREGFNKLHYVSINSNRTFIVKQWNAV